MSYAGKKTEAYTVQKGGHVTRTKKTQGQKDRQYIARIVTETGE